MSRMIDKLDLNSRKRATIANVYSSTPVKSPSNIKHCSLSLSRIDTGSSSDGARANLQLQMQELAKKRKRRTKGKREESTKWRTEDTDSKLETQQKQLIDESINELAKKRKRRTKENKKENTKWKTKDSDSELEAQQKRIIDESINVKRKKNLRNEKRAVKWKRILSRDTDSEWETESEKSANELSGSRRSILNDDERIKLFEDPCTPEPIRDLPSAYEEILPIMRESPIIGSYRKRLHLISKRNSNILQDTLLPVNILPAEVRTLEEADEDETIFNVNNAQTHVPLRNPHAEESSKQKSQNFSSPEFPTTTNNLSRDQSVKTYPGKTSRHSVSSSSRSPMELVDFYRTLPKLPRKRESIQIPPGMVCDGGYSDKTTLKWRTFRIESSSHNQNELKKGKRKTKPSKRNASKFFTMKQKYAVYNITDENDKDNEFETRGRDGRVIKRISFRDFCQKQKAVEIISISSSDS